MQLAELISAHGGQAGLAKALGCDKSYINRVIRRKRPLGPALAIRIYNATGRKLGPLKEEAA
jgi:plasmid maintenance system antidote protein VapI